MNFKTQFLYHFNDKFFIIIIGVLSFVESFCILFSPAMGYDSGFHITQARFLFTHFPYSGWNFWNYFGTPAYLYPPFSSYFVSLFAIFIPIDIAYSISRVLTFCAIPILIYILLRMWSIPQKPSFLASLVVLGSWMYFGDLYVSGYFPQDFSIMMILAFILLYSKSINSTTFISFWPLVTSVCLAFAILSHYYVLFVVPIIMVTHIIINPKNNGRKNIFIRSSFIGFSAIGIASFFLLNYIDAIYNKTLSNLLCCKIDPLALFIPSYDFWLTRYFFGLPFLLIIILAVIVFTRNKEAIRDRLFILAGSWFMLFFVLTASNFMMELTPSPDREISYLVVFAGIVSGLILKKFFDKSSAKTITIVSSTLVMLYIVSAVFGVGFMVMHNPFLEYQHEAEKTADFLNNKMKTDEVVFITSGFDSMWFNVYSNHFQSAGVEGQSAINKQLLWSIASVSSDPDKIKQFMNETGSNFLVLPPNDVEKFAKAGFETEFNSKISSVMHYDVSNNTKFIIGREINDVKYSIGNDQIVITLTNLKPVNIVVRESYSKNWHLQIDNKDEVLNKDEFGFMTFYLPTVGIHQINLKYSALLITIGSLVSIITISIILILIMMKLIRK